MVRITASYLFHHRMFIGDTGSDRATSKIEMTHHLCEITESLGKKTLCPFSAVGGTLWLSLPEVISKSAQGLQLCRADESVAHLQR
jgi:hypothetical protein